MQEIKEIATFTSDVDKDIHIIYGDDFCAQALVMLIEKANKYDEFIAEQEMEIAKERNLLQ